MQAADTVRNAPFICGILAAVAYIAADVACGVLYPGYYFTVIHRGVQFGCSFAIIG